MKRECRKSKMEEELIQRKKSLRKEMLQMRRSLPNEVRLSESKSVCQHILMSEYYRKSDVIMCYISLKEEVGTLSFIQQALTDGKKICVPFVKDKTGIMVAAYIHDLSDLVCGEFNILAPNSDRICLVTPKDIKLILLPGVAFDHVGHRLGMGLGFYDRFLVEVSSARLIALAFSCQIISHVPSEQHDYLMNYIVTKDGIIDCEAGKI